LYKNGRIRKRVRPIRPVTKNVLQIILTSNAHQHEVEGLVLIFTLNQIKYKQ